MGEFLFVLNKSNNWCPLSFPHVSHIHRPQNRGWWLRFAEPSYRPPYRRTQANFQWHEGRTEPSWKFAQRPVFLIGKSHFRSLFARGQPRLLFKLDYTITQRHSGCQAFFREINCFPSLITISMKSLSRNRKPESIDTPNGCTVLLRSGSAA